MTGVFHRKRDFQQSLLWLRPDVGDAEVRQLTAPTPFVIMRHRSAAVIVTTFPNTVRVIEHTLIPLQDGTTLAARIWLPEDAEQRPVPAILEYLPYRKRDGTYERDALTHPYLAGHGYAGVRVDLRGSGESGGLLFDEYAKQEQDDGVEVIAWLAAQPWLQWRGRDDGNLLGRVQCPADCSTPPAGTQGNRQPFVRPMIGTPTMPTTWAARCFTAGLEWASFFFGSMCLPPDPLLVGERWRTMWLQRLENVPFFFERWLQHQRRDDYWKHGSVCEDYEAIQCPVYAVGGWTDAYRNAIPRLLERLNGAPQGSHRSMGAWLSALCPARTANRFSARGATLVGLLAKGD